MVTIISSAGEWEQVSESPDAGQTERIVSAGPARLKLAQPFGNRQAIPVVTDVQKIATFRAGERGALDLERRAAGRVDTALIRAIGRHRGHRTDDHSCMINRECAADRSSCERSRRAPVM